MKILIFGASGATGHHLVSQALRSGYLVTAFVRHAAKVPKEHQNHQNIKLFNGDVTDPCLVEDAMTNQEVIISALGASSPFRRDFKLINGIKNVVAAMKKQNVRRFIYQSFLGVQENRAEFGFLVNTVLSVVLKSVISDHETKENIITASGLNWTIVRCPILTNGSFKGKYRTGEHIVSSSILPLISRADVADFMLNQMTDKKYFHKRPRILY